MDFKNWAIAINLRYEKKNKKNYSLCMFRNEETEQEEKMINNELRVYSYRFKILCGT